jgi:hypothetical protein
MTLKMYLFYRLIRPIKSKAYGQEGEVGNEKTIYLQKSFV